ncbi:hypothetical protein BU681_08685 [Staphylococcus chromogenes]|nr:hypothetical protein BU686_11200 [Staphylococcus chromogenes]PTG57226.1 hypothetical protein BU682_11040 [Staphylococcus chromogenes]RIM14311.1 hypothetical protein BU681_08685 [Staphylococcus chromogenes]
MRLPTYKYTYTKHLFIMRVFLQQFTTITKITVGLCIKNKQSLHFTQEIAFDQFMLYLIYFSLRKVTCMDGEKSQILTAMS